MASFERNDRFENRHIGTTGPALAQMLRQLGVSSLDELIDQTVPAQIRLNKKLQLPPAIKCIEALSDRGTMVRSHHL